MFGSKNKVILAGNLGRDAEIVTFQNGDRIAVINIADSESWTDRATGERKEKTNWHRVTLRAPGLVKMAEKTLKKGDKVMIEGQIVTRKWVDQQGAERSATEIVLPPYTGELDLLPKSSARVNKVVLMGNLGRDPEAITFQNGEQIVILSVATSESWLDKRSNERKERTEWHRVVLRDPQLIKTALSYMKKGMKVYLEGQLEVRRWTDQSGQEHFGTEVVLRGFNSTMQMLTGPDRGDQAQGGQSQGGERRASAPARAGKAPAPATPPAAESGMGDFGPGPSMGGGFDDDLEDSIPF